MKESSMWAKLKNNYLASDVFLRRVEMLYFPDIFFKTKDDEGWIELKQTVFRDPIVIPFRVGQLNWLKSYIDMGGNANILVSINDNEVLLFKNDSITDTYGMSKALTVCSYYGTLQSLPFNILFTHQLKLNP